MKNLKVKYFFFKKFSISIEYFKKSLYFTRLPEPKSIRIDYLFGLNRSFYRKKKVYIYVFHLGRFAIRFMRK